MREADAKPYKDPPGTEEGYDEMEQMVWPIIVDNHTLLLEWERKVNHH